MTHVTITDKPAISEEHRVLGLDAVQQKRREFLKKTKEQSRLRYKYYRYIRNDGGSNKGRTVVNPETLYTTLTYHWFFHCQSLLCECIYHHIKYQSIKVLSIIWGAVAISRRQKFINKNTQNNIQRLNNLSLNHRKFNKVRITFSMEMLNTYVSTMKPEVNAENKSTEFRLIKCLLCRIESSEQSYVLGPEEAYSMERG